MNPKIFISVVLLCVGQTVYGQGIEEIKKNALQRIEFNVDSIKKIINETQANLPKRDAYLGTITEHERKFGDGIYLNYNFEIQRSASSNYIMIYLRQSSNNVLKCVQFREKEGLDDSKKYYNEKFLRVGSDYEKKAIQAQRDAINIWREEYKKAINEYSDIYQKAVNEIYKSKDEAHILAIVKDFENISVQMARIVTSVNVNITKNQIAILEILDRLVFDMKKYLRMRVDRTVELMAECYKQTSLV